LVWLFYSAQELKYFAYSLLASSTFSANIFYYLINNDYFSTDQFILKHLWSLSTEIQFYLIFPLLLLIFNNLLKQKKNLINIFFFIFCLSIILNILFQKNINLVFYHLPFRIWEFLFGYFIYIKFFEKSDIQLKINSFFIFFILYLIFGESELLKKQIIAATLFYLLFFISYKKDNILNKLLNSQILQNLSKYSYEIFLIHFPVIELIKFFEITESFFEFVVLSVSITFLMVLTNSILEKKFYFRIKKIKLHIFLFFLILLIFFASIFALTKGTKFRIVMNKNLPKEYFSYLERSKRGRCDNFCYYENSNSSSILLFGDSHAADFESIFLDYSIQNKKNLFIEYSYRNKDTIDGQILRLNEILNHNNIATVVIVHHIFIDHDIYLNELIKIIKNNQNTNFFYFGPRIEFDKSPIKYNLIKKDLNKIKILNLENLDVLKKISKIKKTNFKYISQNDILLNLDKSCMEIDCFRGHDENNYPFYSDNHHLNSFGARLVFDEIVKYNQF